jgi:hypothetical protein
MEVAAQKRLWDNDTNVIVFAQTAPKWSLIESAGTGEHLDIIQVDDACAFPGGKGS